VTLIDTALSNKFNKMPKKKLKKNSPEAEEFLILRINI